MTRTLKLPLTTSTPPVSSLPAASTQNQSRHPCLFLDEIIHNVFSRFDSPKTLLVATQVCKQWSNAITLDIAQKIAQKTVLPKSLHYSRLYPRNLLSPRQLLCYILNQNNNFIQGRYAHNSLKVPVLSPLQRTQRLLSEVGPDNQLLAMTFLNDGKLIRVFKFHICITNSQTLKEKEVVFNLPIKSCIITKESNKILIREEGNLRGEIIDFQDKSESWIISTPANLPNDIKDIYAGHLSPKGDFLVVRRDNEIQFFNLKKREYLTILINHKPSSGNSFYFSPNHKHLVAILNKHLLIWDYSQALPQPIAFNSNFSNQVRSVNFSPSGNKFVAKTYFSTNFLIDLGSNPLKITELESDYGENRNTFHFLPDEDQLIMHNHIEKSISLIDVDLNKSLLHTLQQPDNSEYDESHQSCLSPDGKRLAVINSTENGEIYLDIVNLSSQGTVNQEVIQMPRRFPLDFSYCDCDSNQVIFSSLSNQICLSPDNYDQSFDNDPECPSYKQLLLDFSPVF